VPYLAIGLFAGVRPMNELRGIEWERDIDWQDNRIIVKRASSKTNRSRSVPMSENLRAWLEAVPKAKRKGRIFYSRRLLDWITGREPKQDRRIKRPGALAATYKKKGRKPRKRLPPLPWGQDIMRHTRTTYRLGETKNAALVAEEGGHTQAIMELHYVNRTIPQADVKKFWGIMPTPAGSKGRKGGRK
jgi:integrase